MFQPHVKTDLIFVSQFECIHFLLCPDANIASIFISYFVNRALTFVDKQFELVILCLPVPGTLGMFV